MLFKFYYKTIKTIPIILSVLLIALSISILVVNRNLSDSFDNQDQDNFDKLLKTQKGLIWTNYSIVIVSFIYFLIIYIYFILSRHIGYANRYEYIIPQSGISIAWIVIFTSLVYYIHSGLNGINSLNVNDKEKYSQLNDEIKKIYIIIPIVCIISLSFLFILTKSSSRFIGYSNYSMYEEMNDPVSVTITRPISSSSRRSSYLGLNDRQSPYINYDYEDY